MSELPPHSTDNERMVLGSMLTSIGSLNIAADSLDDSDFYFPEHKTIFQSLKACYKNDKPADVHIVCEELKRKNKLTEVGGVDYLTKLAQYAGTSAYIEEYIKELKRYTSARRVRELSLELNKRALGGEDPQKLIIFAQEGLKLIERSIGEKDKFPIMFLDDLPLHQNFLLAKPPEKAMLLDYASPFGKKTGFLPKGIVAMLVGAGGVGKTHLLAQLAISVATSEPFLDRFTTTQHCGPGNIGNVFLGFGENQNEDIHRLLYKASKNLRKIEPEFEDDKLLLSACKHIAFFSFCGQQAAFIQDGKPSIYFRQFKMRLVERAPENGWALIILDPVSRLMGVDAETDNAAATQFIALLEELSIDLPGNPTVLFAHHVTKNSRKSENQDQTAARGASALTDGVRWQCNYSKEVSNKGEETNIAILKMTKTNFTAVVEAIKTKKDFDGFISIEEKSESLNTFSELNF